MSVKGTRDVTITLERTTVAMLRSKKRGLETWNELMLRLGSRGQFGLECVICGAFLEMDDKDGSPNALGKENGWQQLYSEVTHVGGGETARQMELGYICPSCVTTFKG